MKELSDKITKWYLENKRDLPWRKDQNPYHVWISEIMLQQTRIEAVLSYYQRFMKELPTIESLSKVEDDKLLKLWEGLGYYNRARNLKKAAIEIMEKHHGTFPNTFEEIISLPGIGEYTASAISSICFSLPEVTIDGNVLRVYTRVFEDNSIIDQEKTRKQIREKLMKIVPKNSGDFNEGLMELGETICLPNGIPKCEICPLKDLCQSRKNKTSLNYPVKNPKKEKKIEHLTVFMLIKENKILIEKRMQEGVLQGLWQFPNINQVMTKKEVEEYCNYKNIHPIKIEKGISYTHIFTHKKWVMNSYIITLDNKENLEGIFVTKEMMEEAYSIPGAFQPFKNDFIKRGVANEKKCRNFNIPEK